MVDAPERIWAAKVTDNYGEWQISKDGLPRPVEYVRAEAAERLAGARVKATSDELSRYIERCRELSDGGEYSWWSRLAEILSALAEPAGEVTRQCETCQGNGEIITDWDRHRHPHDGDVGDEAVAECSDCNGEGLVSEPAGEAHPDDLAVDRFAIAMKAKLARKRAEGRGGWDNREECSAEHLSYLLIRHCLKGDPLDVGNLAMMLHQRGDRIVIDEETASIMRRPEPAGEAEPLSAQIERLASFIMEHVPGEPSQSEGAVDCAIRIIRNSLTTPPASAIREAAKRVIWFDWSENDPDAVAAIDGLRAALAGAKP